MAKNMQPIAKRCRALGISPAVMGYSKKTSNRNPGGKMRRKKSEYSMQLTEKQKVKFIYGIMEKQFRAYYEKAEKAEGKTGAVLLTLIERRLDNVIFRLGLAATRREARQLVSHSHFGVTIEDVSPSAIALNLAVERLFSLTSITSPTLTRYEGMFTFLPFTVKWLEKNENLLGGKVVAAPQREDIDFPVEEHLIVELYSK